MQSIMRMEINVRNLEELHTSSEQMIDSRVKRGE